MAAHDGEYGVELRGSSSSSDPVPATMTEHTEPTRSLKDVAADLEVSEKFAQEFFASTEKTTPLPETKKDCIHLLRTIDVGSSHFVEYFQESCTCNQRLSHHAYPIAMHIAMRAADGVSDKDAMVEWLNERPFLKMCCRTRLWAPLTTVVTPATEAASWIERGTKDDPEAVPAPAVIASIDDFTLPPLLTEDGAINTDLDPLTDVCQPGALDVGKAVRRRGPQDSDSD